MYPAVSKNFMLKSMYPSLLKVPFLKLYATSTLLTLMSPLNVPFKPVNLWSFKILDTLYVQQGVFLQHDPLLV